MPSLQLQNLYRYQRVLDLDDSVEKRVCQQKSVTKVASCKGYNSFLPTSPRYPMEN